MVVVLDRGGRRLIECLSKGSVLEIVRSPGGPECRILLTNIDITDLFPDPYDTTLVETVERLNHKTQIKCYRMKKRVFIIK